MARQTWDDEDEEDDWDAANMDDEDEDSTIPCPYCGCDVHEDSPRCPACENYLSLEDAPVKPTGKPWWVLLGAGLGLLVFVRWLFL
jgi:hypothetical protein